MKYPKGYKNPTLMLHSNRSHLENPGSVHTRHKGTAQIAIHTKTKIGMKRGMAQYTRFFGGIVCTSLVSVLRCTGR